MIALKAVKEEEREQLWQLLQDYLAEIALFYGEEREDGVYPYRYFDAYFTEKERKALFLYEGETLLGFALLNPYSYIGESPDLVLAEFSVLPPFRRAGKGREAAEAILAAYPGKWEIKYHQRNTAAGKLWRSLTESCSPAKHLLGAEEIVLSFDTLRS